ncbi:putative athila retroelement ORF1 protein, partial [Trifolium pratense]
MRRTGTADLQYDPEIEKTARANRKAVREAQRAATREGNNNITEELEAADFEMDDPVEANPPPPPPPPQRRTLGDYGRRDNDVLANQGFQPANPVSFDIKNTVLSALKENPYSGAEAQCSNLHLS